MRRLALAAALLVYAALAAHAAHTLQPRLEASTDATRADGPAGVRVDVVYERALAIDADGFTAAVDGREVRLTGSIAGLEPGGWFVAETVTDGAGGLRVRRGLPIRRDRAKWAASLAALLALAYLLLRGFRWTPAGFAPRD